MAHPKGLLIEKAQKLGLERPEFDTAKTGPEHEPAFITDVVLDGEVIGTGQGRSKRESEKAAASEALGALDSRGGGGRGRNSGKGGSRPAAQRAEPDASAAGQAEDEDQEHDDDEAEDEHFTGPWPMFDDLLASVLTVAEKRVTADLRGDAARVAIRDFSLKLYKELLADLGEVVDEDEEDDD